MPNNQEHISEMHNLPSRLSGPSASYLAIARSKSVHISTPSTPVKKLLILDLNGTLLLRPKPRNAKHRPILPRPYIPTFRSFLFHKEVASWLDVMVWSSAKPHNVDEMVERCFSHQKRELKAVWARDTLGLPKKDYSKKVQTIKDLRKIWSKFSKFPQSSIAHTAETTLLLDDSALKVQLQPYNHLCIPEYTRNLRNLDLECLQKERQVAETHRKANHESFDYDSTLIAVIGFLDEMKNQSNVAGWIYEGGLWAGHIPPPTRESFELFSADETEKDRTIKPHHSASANPGNDAKIGQSDLMWFEHEPCYRYWVDRGKAVIQDLGLQLEHGVE